MTRDEFDQISRVIDSVTTLDELTRIEHWLNKCRVQLNQWERNKMILEAAKRAGIDPTKL